MRRLELATVALTGVLFASGLSAQGKDFSGKWVPDNEKTQASADAATVARGGTPGHTTFRVVYGPLTVTQDAKTLTAESEIQNVTTKNVYNLDGSESKNSVPGRQGAPPTEQVSTAKWDGDKLVITTKAPTGDRVQMWYLENGELVNEVKGSVTSTKVYYKKS